MTNLTKSEQAAVYAHFPEITEKMIDYATNEVLKKSKYIFVTKGPHKKGYCTHCHSNFFVEDLIKQNAIGTCPKCQSHCIYKKAWLGRKYLWDAAYFLWFEKSLINPQMITASWVYCKRSYNGSYENVQTECKRTVLYTFEMGGSSMYDVYYWNGNKLEKKKSVYNNTNHSIPFEIAVESLIDAVKATPFQYSGWEKYSRYDYLKYLALYSEMPNIEVLTKNGFTSIVRTKMNGESLHRAIDWKAYKLHEFFKITKQDFQMLKNTDATGQCVMYAPDFTFGLWMWQQARKEKSKMTYKQIINACNAFNLTTYTGPFKKVKKYSSMHRLVNYAQKQFEQDSKHYRMPSQVIVNWADYIDECKKLDYDLNNERILYPKNLREAHRRTSKLIEIKADELANLKIMKRYEQSKNLVFENDGLLIRPPMSIKEIVDEGKKLAHCVGNYIDRHSKAACTLLFVRKANKPDMPFYTVELKDNRIVQVRGHDNKPATEKVQKFMDQYKTAILEKPKAKVRKQA